MAIGTQFLIISDTHGHWPYNETNPAPKVDVLVHCGDLTQIGGLPSSRKAIAQLKSIDAEIRLVIAGNHDIELDQQWCLDNGDDDDMEVHHNAMALFKEDSEIQYLEEGI